MDRSAFPHRIGPRGKVVFPERADRQDHRLVERFRVDAHGMPDAVWAGK